LQGHSIHTSASIPEPRIRHDHKPCRNRHRSHKVSREHTCRPWIATNVTAVPTSIGTAPYFGQGVHPERPRFAKVKEWGSMVQITKGFCRTAIVSILSPVRCKPLCHTLRFCTKQYRRRPEFKQRQALPYSSRTDICDTSSQFWSACNHTASTPSVGSLSDLFDIHF
jgi:hypothetical protein